MRWPRYEADNVQRDTDTTDVNLRVLAQIIRQIVSQH